MIWCKTPGASRRANLGMHAYLPQQILPRNLSSYQRPQAANQYPSPITTIVQEYLAALDPPDHDVVQNTGCVKTG
jgi:hypothetical protein